MYDTPIEETGHTGLPHDSIGTTTLVVHGNVTVEPTLPVNVAFLMADRGWNGDR